MQEHFRKYAKYGLVMSSILLPILTTDKGKGIDMDEATINYEKNKDKRPEKGKNLRLFDDFSSENAQKTPERCCHRYGAIRLCIKSIQKTQLQSLLKIYKKTFCSKYVLFNLTTDIITHSIRIFL